MSARYSYQTRSDLVDPRGYYGGVTTTLSQPSARKLAIKVPILLLLFFILATGIGVAHQFFYSFLNGRLAKNQAWMLRAGTALAYLAKLLFALSIGSAFTQRLWQSLRSKHFTLGAVDNLFDLKNDPTRLLKFEVLTRAKASVLVALSIWALPILPIIAPGSISVKPRANTIFSAQVPTTTLNFSRSHDPSSPLVGSSVYTVNFAEVNGVGAAFNGYSGPSSRAKGLIYSTVYGGQVLSPDSPCGPNCTFNQTFNGPAYQCRDIDYTKPDPSNPFCQKDCTQYFSTPTRNAFDIEWYTAKNSTGGTCKDCSGEAWQDGKLWVGYQYLPPQYRTQSGDPPVNTTPIADTALEKHIFVCQSYNATYNLQITYIDFQQSIIGELQFLNPINYSIEAFQAAQGLSSYAGYAVHQQLYQILSGNIGLNGRMIPIDSTGLGGTQLVEQLPFPQPNLTNADNRPGKIGIQKPVRNLRAAIEQLHFNITVGMLTIPHLIYLQNETTAAYVTTFENKWSYNWVPLVAVYGGCALLNILAILIGAAAIVHNDGLGVGRTGFLRMLMTSRNHTLDTIVGSRGRGDDNTQEEIEDVKVRFGELRDARTGSGSGCVAFGVEGEVLELRKR